MVAEHHADRFVPLDTAFYSPGYRDMVAAAYSGAATRSRIDAGITANSEAAILGGAAGDEATNDRRGRPHCHSAPNRRSGSRRGGCSRSIYEGEIVKALCTYTT